MIPITTTNQGRRGAAGGRMPSNGNRNSSSDKKLAAFLVLTGLLLWGVLYMSTGEDVPNVQNPDRRHALGDHEQRSPVHAAVHGHEHDYHHEPGAQPGAAAGTVGGGGKGNGNEEGSEEQRRRDTLHANPGTDSVDTPNKKLRPSDQQCADTIRRAIKSTWDGYVSSGALGYDEVRPIGKTGKNWWSGSYPLGTTMTASVHEGLTVVQPQAGAGAGGVRSVQVKTIQVQATKGLGMMVIDSLDTLWLAGMKSEFDLGVRWVKENFCPECTQERVSFFEVTIRVLGGLLSAYELSGEVVLKEAAIKIGNVLYNAITEDKRRIVPRAYVRLNGPTWYDRLLRWFSPLSYGAFELDDTNIVIIGSIQLEFYKLSEISQDPKFEALATRMMRMIFHYSNDEKERLQNTQPGLPVVKYDYDGTCPHGDRWPLEPLPGQTRRFVAPLGAHGDSYYEYLLKVFIYRAPALTQEERDKSEELQSWLEASKVMTRSSDSIKPPPYGGDDEDQKNNPSHFVPEWFMINIPAASGVWQELTCFAGGLWALSSATVGTQQDLETAIAYTKTCENARIWMRSGLPPEQVKFQAFHGGLYFGESKWEYRLRPEMFESFFYLWLLTGEPMYKQQAWDFFIAIHEELFVESTGMYAAATDVRSRPIPKDRLDDRMETFWVAETLKYLLMIFSFPAQPEMLEHRKPWQSAYPGALQFPKSLCSLATGSGLNTDGRSAVEQCTERRFVLTTEAHPMTVLPLNQKHHSSVPDQEKKEWIDKEKDYQ